MTDNARTQGASSSNASAMMSGAEAGDLFGRTLRSVATLVGACVLFVGGLSAVAVAVTSKAVGASPSAAEVHEVSPPAAPKKPLSI